jgi:serine/threonine protein kinase
LEARQCFRFVDSVLQFEYTRVVYLRDGTKFCGKLASKTNGYPIDVDMLKDVETVPEWHRPLYMPHYTVAPNPNQCFVKKPKLTADEDPETIPHTMIQELEICEILRKQPHPNIATYQGCKLTDGRVEGLCFTAYRMTLMESINPGSLNKATFINANDRVVARKHAAEQLPSLEDAVRYIHSLGLIHNDFNPSNILLGTNGFVVSDFGSSRIPGASLVDVKRTYGWHDPDVNVSQASNDLDALAELRVWLTGSSPNDFHFSI